MQERQAGGMYTHICISSERAGILVFKRPSLRFKLRFKLLRFFFFEPSAPPVSPNPALHIEEVISLRNP